MTLPAASAAVRVAWAKMLISAGCDLLEGGDDRVVILNTKRLRSPRGPRAGLVEAFIATGHKTALAFAKGEAPPHMGTPVPARVAQLAGWKVGSHK